MVKKFTIPFASQGDANDIPDALQVDGKVSFTQGFSYDYERPYDDPQAKDIAREDMNGIFKAITSAVGELQTLGASEWSNAIDYPKGAIVYYEKDLYISQVDDNKNKPPQSWTSIKNIADDSLKKAMNLSDLTDKATARKNLGLGNSATLNKTDVLGTSTSLVATQKLVNDTRINLESSKQDKLTFVGDGPDVMKTGAYGLGVKNLPRLLDEGFETNTSSGLYAFDHTSSSEEKPFQWGSLIALPYSSSTDRNNMIAMDNFGKILAFRGTQNNTSRKWSFVYHTKNTTTDKSGFLRATGSANALTESDRTSSLGTSSTLVASQKLVNDVSTRTTTAQSRADSAYTLANSKITGGSVVQSTGTSTTNVMSQKAVTDLSFALSKDYRNVTENRSFNTEYTNTYNRAIAVSIYTDSRVSNAVLEAVINGETIYISREVGANNNSVNIGRIYVVVPPFSRYEIRKTSGTQVIEKWSEL